MNFSISANISESYNYDKTDQRLISAFLILFMTFKSLYFLRLNSLIAPQIDSIFTILNEIKDFLIVFITIFIAFVLSFWVLGFNRYFLWIKSKNNYLNDPEKDLKYYGFFNAFTHVWKASFK